MDVREEILKIVQCDYPISFNTFDEKKLMNEEMNSGGAGTTPKKTDSIKFKVSLVVATILAIGLISFIVQNMNPIKIEFLAFDFRVRIIYLMLFSMLLGVIATYAFQKYRRNKKNKK